MKVIIKELDNDYKNIKDVQELLEVMKILSSVGLISLKKNLDMDLFQNGMKTLSN